MVDLGVSFDRKLGIELVMPNIQFARTIAKKTVGIVITHGHEDHIGAIPHLWQQLNLPIYATKFTAELIRAKLKSAGLLDQAKIIEIDINHAIDLYPFNIKYVPITHSIPESHLLKISTEKGTIVHTGDWKFDNNPLIGDNSDTKQMKSIGDEGVLALVCDSTNVFEPGSSGSELDVKKSLEKLIAKQKQRIVVTCFASNIARLITFITIAKKYNKKIILAGKSLWKMIKNAEKCGYIDSTEDILTDKSFDKIPPTETMIICTGSQGEERAALFRIATKQHPSIKLDKKDTLIFSSKIIPGNEKEVLLLHELFLQQGVKIINEQDKLVHVSGHPHQDELKQMYSFIKPKILVPVHGENRHLRAHQEFAKKCGVSNAIIGYNGSIVELNENKPKIIGSVEHGRYVLDGSIVTDINSNHLQQRNVLANNGTVFISINKQQIPDNGVNVSVTGLPNQNDKHSIEFDIETVIYDTLHNSSDKTLKSKDKLSQHIINVTQKLIKILISKKPIIHCHIH